VSGSAKGQISDGSVSDICTMQTGPKRTAIGKGRVIHKACAIASGFTRAKQGCNARDMLLAE